MTKTKGDIEHSLLSIDLIGSKYLLPLQIETKDSFDIECGRTSFHPLNKKSGQIVPLKIDSKPNAFNLTMLDIGELQACEFQLANSQNDSAYFISKMYIHRGHYYE